MFCTNCGNGLLSNQKFCKKCGVANPHFLLPKSVIPNPKKVHDNTKPLVSNVTPETKPVHKKVKLAKPAGKNGLIKRIIIILIITCIIWGASFFMYGYLSPNSFGKAITTIEKGELEKCIEACTEAYRKHEQGQLHLSVIEQEKLDYIQQAALDFQNRLTILRKAITDMPFQSLEQSHASFVELENRSFVNFEGRFELNLNQAISSLTRAHDSLVIQYISQRIPAEEIIYPNREKRLIYSASNTYLDIDSLFSLVINSEEPMTKEMIRQLSVGIPARPSDTFLFYDNLHKGDSAVSQNQIVLAKTYYETALLFKPNDSFTIKKLETLNALEQKVEPLNKHKSTEAEIVRAEAKKEEVIKNLEIYLLNSIISWTDFGRGWTYDIKIVEKDAGITVVIFESKESSKIELPLDKLIDHRLYIISIESRNGQRPGPAKSKAFSLVNNGTKIDPTCH